VHLTVFHHSSHFFLIAFLSINMLAVNILGLVLATAVSAVPVIEHRLNSTKWTPEHILQPGEVILFGDGRSKYRRYFKLSNTSI
jgi:hypothetical protein